MMIETFYKPKTIKEALGLKKKFKKQAVYLSGGTFVNSKDFPRRPEVVISLAALHLNRIEKKAGVVSMGALCTLQELIENKKVPQVLKNALSQIRSRNVRNMSTLGGHVAANRACSDVMPMLLALHAKVELSGKAKLVLLSDYLKSKSDEIVTQIVLPQIASDRFAGCRNVRPSANSRSAYTAAVSVTVRKSDQVLLDPVIVLSGVVGFPIRLTSIEKALNKKPMPNLEQIQEMVSPLVKTTSCRASCLSPCVGSELVGSPEFNRYRAGVVVAQALENALQRKGVCSC